MRRKKLHRAKTALLVLAAVLLCDIPSTSHATTTQEQLEEALQEREHIQDKIDENNDQLDELKDTQSGLKAELGNLNGQLGDICDTLAELESKIAEKEEEIAVTTAKLEDARATERWQYNCMVQRIQYMYEQGELDYWTILFSGGSLADALNYGDYFNAIAEYDQNMLKEYEDTRAFIEGEEARLEQEKAELDAYLVAAQAEQSKVAGLISQTSNSIARYGDDIAKLEEVALAYEAELKKQDEDIEALRKKIAEEKALSQAAANAAWRNISEVSFADGDRALLANIIYCEAGGEPYEGKLAVGAVVINRLLSSKYPDTVVGVIYQRSQFSPVASGRLDLALATNKATESCYRAADEAMSGATNVGNCLYFRTPIEGLTGIRIGGHVFY